MRIFRKQYLDPSLDFQLIDCGDGRLAVYTLGRNTDTLALGEVAIRKIEHEIADMNDSQAQVLIQRYYEEAMRLRAQRGSQTPQSKTTLKLAKDP